MNVNKENMNIVIVGHVDHGKSTIIGRLLADTGSLPEGKLESVKEMCRRNSKPFEYAFLLDALKDEQAQGITIDSARCFFNTIKRNYIIIDAPGHIEFLKNMVTGASRAEAALLVIDAKEGVQENSKRHGYLLSMLGIKQITVLVNKMDLVDYEQKRFDEIEVEYREFLKSINVEPLSFIPVSGFFGDNIKGATDNIPWYKGLSVLDTLDSFVAKDNRATLEFRMPIQGIYKFTQNGDDRRIIAGTVETGHLKVGDQVTLYPSGKKTRVKTIEEFNTPTRTEVGPGYATGFTMEEQIYAKRGELVVKEGERAPLVSTKIDTKLFWLGKKPLQKGKDYFLKIGTSKVTAQVEEIKRVLDASTLSALQKDVVERNDVAEVIIRTNAPIAFDLSRDLDNTSRFVIVDDYEISGGGIIEESLDDRSKKKDTEDSLVGKRARAERYSQKPSLVLLTGKEEAGLDIISKKLEKNLFDSGRFVYYLDGDKERENFECLGTLSNHFVSAGKIFILKVNDISKDELDILYRKVEGEVEVVWLGDNVNHNLNFDLVLDNILSEEESVEKVREHLGHRGIIFNSWFYTI